MDPDKLKERSIRELKKRHSLLISAIKNGLRMDNEISREQIKEIEERLIFYGEKVEPWTFSR